MTYRIRNWDRHYESSDTRKLVSLHWVKIPNQQDSLAYRLIAAHPKGAEIFAAWILMVQVASKAKKEERGNLPLSPEELGIITGFPVKIFALAIEFLKSPKIGWIEQSPGGLPESPDASGNPPENLPLKERKKEEKEGKNIPLPPSGDLSLKSIFDEARKAFPGQKNGLEVEWENFKRKHPKVFVDATALLLPAIKKEIRFKSECARVGAFVPPWKHFQTWINGSFWTQEFPSEVIVNGR